MERARPPDGEASGEEKGERLEKRGRRKAEEERERWQGAEEEKRAKEKCGDYANEG